MNRRAVERLPISIQTLYADLSERAWRSNLEELMAAGGSAYRRSASGRDYWYWQPPTRDGVRPSARYLGPDSPGVRQRIQERNALAAVRKDRLEMVRALAAAKLPAPDSLTGRVLLALSEAGAFRLRAVVVGTTAFQCYGPMLGFRVPAGLGRTEDLDIGQFHSVSLAVDDRIDEDLLPVLWRADRRFEAIASPVDSRRAQRYAIRTAMQETFSVDILTPLRGPDRSGPVQLKALRGHAQLLRFLDFLLYQEVDAVVLHGPGIPVKVPEPERFALHKLLVSQLRRGSAANRAKSRKDLAQAGILIQVLAQDRPFRLAETWRELLGRGPAWRQLARQAVGSLPDDPRGVLESYLPEDSGRSGATTRDGPEKAQSD